MNFSEFDDFKIDSASLKKIRVFSRNVLEKEEELIHQQEELVLAISEAAQNIIKHAYEGKPHSDKMRIKISLNEKDLKIDLYDNGKVVDPKDIKPRKLDDIKPGGLGTFFINHIMDEFFFEKNNAHDWVNHLVLKKKIT
jgi:serine/threonine-protein kinase RsbW